MAPPFTAEVGPAGQSRVWSHWLVRALLFVIGYNWLVTATILPVPLLTFWTLAAARPPVASICAAAYTVSEVTAFCTERNWSRVRVCHFWQFAAPLCVVQALLCIRYAHRDPLGCLLFSLICIGLRETLFEFFYAGVAVGGYSMKERATSACLGGFTYSASLAVLCGASYILVHMVQGKVDALSTSMLEMLYLVILPSSRALLRMLLTQLTSGLALGPLDNSSRKAPSTPGSAGNGESESPPLDAFVLSSDLAFAVTMYLEVPLVFLLLLIPRGMTFCMAVALNAVCDVLFCYVLDVLQKRRVKLLMGSPQAAGSVLERWSPRFLHERPVSVVAALLSGGVTAQELHEADCLQSPDQLRLPPSERAPPAPSAPAAGPSPRAPPRGCGARLASVLSACRGPELCNARRMEPESCNRSTSLNRSGAMSPRVSLLLDEYDAALVSPRTTGACGDLGCGGQAVCLLQDRKAAFITHLLGNTLAVALAAVCVPALTMQPMGGKELAWRLAVLLMARFVADLAACWTLECGGYAGLWESRHELRTFHGWLQRGLTSLGPLFPVLAAAAAGPAAGQYQPVPAW